MKLGKLYEACLTIEGYQSSGWADVYANTVTIGEDTKKNKESDVPGKPVVSAKISDDGKITITIEKNENASGYRIYVKKPGSKKYKKLKTIKKNGKKVRKYTFSPSADGEYSFKVKAYTKTDGKTVWGSNSKVVKVR